jgi:hypothetical protein
MNRELKYIELAFDVLELLIEREFPVRKGREVYECDKLFKKVSGILIA